MPSKTTNELTETVEETVSEATEKVSEATDKAEQAAQTAANKASKTFNEAFKQVEKQVESLSKTLTSALQDRANVVMVRVNNDSLAYLDMLVEADVTKSRSESAAFLINEGIKGNEALFNRIREITDQISALKSQLRGAVRTEE